jgi:hypothetical protein
MWHKPKMADRPAPDSDAQRDALVQELFESKRFAVQLAIERQHLSDAVDTMRSRERAAADAEIAPLLDAARRERDAAAAARDRAYAERDAALAARDQARAEAHDAIAMLERVTSSTAWRVTGPARRLLQGLLRR